MGCHDECCPSSDLSAVSACCERCPRPMRSSTSSRPRLLRHSRRGGPPSPPPPPRHRRGRRPAASSTGDGILPHLQLREPSHSIVLLRVSITLPKFLQGKTDFIVLNLTSDGAVKYCPIWTFFEVVASVVTESIGASFTLFPIQFLGCLQRPQTWERIHVQLTSG